MFKPIRIALFQNNLFTHAQSINSNLHYGRIRFVKYWVVIMLGLICDFSYASLVNCQANRPTAGNILYLYYPNGPDSNFPANVGPMEIPLNTSIDNEFDVADLASGIGSTTNLINAITQLVKIDLCEFDVHVIKTRSSNGTTNPPPTDSRWQIVGIGSDSNSTVPMDILFGIADDIDTGDNNVNDYARVFGGAYAQVEGGEGGALNGTGSTLDRWANAIAGTVSHEAAHNYGAGHDDSISRTSGITPQEDPRKNHLLGSRPIVFGGLSGNDQAKDRHFSDTSYELLANNIALYEKTVSNWDFINPNNATADHFAITILVPMAEGVPTVASIYSGDLSPWSNVSIIAHGTHEFKGTNYSRFKADFISPKSWANGSAGAVSPGVSFHVGFGLTTSYIVHSTEFRSGNSVLPLHPRVVGYSTETDPFSPFSGDMLAALSISDGENGLMMMSNIRISHLPRTLDINQMIDDGSLTDADNRPFRQWKQFRSQQDAIEVDDVAQLIIGNLSETRAVQQLRGKNDDCKPGIYHHPDDKNAPGTAYIEYCPERHVLGLFPAARVYVEATVTDPNAKYFDPNIGEIVTGPLESRLFFQLSGKTPDLNKNGVDDTIDIADKYCDDLNRNGVCDDVERK